MKSTIARFGFYAALTILVLSAINLFVVDKIADYTTQEVAGYLTMLLAMIFVFAGIRHYRDHKNNGLLSFGEGLKIGALIVLIPSLFFGLFDLMYTEIINPQWKTEYFNHYIEHIKETAPVDKVDSELKKLQMQKEMFDKPVIQFLLMSGTVFVIGMIVTIISAIALRRKKDLTS